MTDYFINYETVSNVRRSVTVTAIDAAHAKATVLRTITEARKIINCTRLPKSRQ